VLTGLLNQFIDFLLHDRERLLVLFLPLRIPSFQLCFPPLCL